MNNPNTRYGETIKPTDLLVDKFVEGDYKTLARVLAGESGATVDYPQGTPVAEITADGDPNEGKLVKYDPAGTDGSEVCVGLLANNLVRATDRTRKDADGNDEATDVQISVFVPGGGGRFVKAVLDNLGLDATAIGQLGATVDGDYLSI